MGLPKTAVSIFSFILFTGWLMALLLFNTINETNLRTEIEDLTEIQNNLANAGTGVNSSDILGSIISVFQIILNVLLMMFVFFTLIFSSVAGFIAVVLHIPFIISGIFLALILTGLMFALISKLVDI